MNSKSKSPSKKQGKSVAVAKKVVAPSFNYNEQELKSLDYNKVFNEKQRTKYKEIFIFFDKTQSGYVKREDLPFMLRAVGLLVGTYDVRQVAEKLDTDKSGKLNLRQYQQAIYVFKDKKPVREEIEGSLTIFDKEKNGQVDVNELKNILMNMGDIVTQQEFESVFHELKSQKGKVKMNELIELLMIQPQ